MNVHLTQMVRRLAAVRNYRLERCGFSSRLIAKRRIEPRKPRIESFADRPLAASRYRPQSTGSLRTSARLDAQILFTAGICRFA
jgi:hypothetical protein